MKKRLSFCLGALSLACAIGLGSPLPATAQTEAKSYEDRLLRLSVILGAVHHLREICSANEGQLWRQQMSDILAAENPPAQLRERMVSSFNTAYRDYQRTYNACSSSAKTVADRFFTEGAEITRQMSNNIETRITGSEGETTQ